jgi:5-methylcytosine-specific restriction protein A
MRRDQRSPEADAYRRFYHLSRWKHPITGVRARQLTKQPLCEMCLKAGRLTVATVCDHIDPKAKETEEGFFRGPFASLCKAHHDSGKQGEEKRGYTGEADADGWPADPRHPNAA